MKNYGLSNDKRKMVLGITFVISLLLGAVLFPIINALLDKLYLACPKMKAFLDSWEYLGIFSAQVTAFVIFEFLTRQFDKRLWKWKIFKNLLNVPDLNGVWEGGYQSIRTEKTGNIISNGDMKLTITQTWTKMVCRCEFTTSESYSDVVYLDVDSPQGVVLKFTYTNKSHDVSNNLPEFSGYNELTLSDKNTLTGTYYTKRIPSTRGNMLLVRRTKDDEINEGATS